MNREKDKNQEYFSYAVQHVSERFGCYHVETGAALIQLRRYNNGSSLLDAVDLCEQQIQEIMESLLRAT